MCGLVGVAGSIGPKQDKVLKELLIIDSLRGAHSTGVAFVRGNLSDVEVVKASGDTYEMLPKKNFTSNLLAKNRVIIGHNRYATKGAINRANAHPFDFDGLVGAHNGTLTTQYLLDDNKNFDVDSENLYHHMNKFGVQDAISKAGGAWALTWWDKKEGTLNLLRNKERPLYYTYSEDFKTLYWASEDWMLTGILGRNGLKHKGIHLLPEEVLHKQVIPNADGVLKAMEVINVEAYKRPQPKAPVTKLPVKNAYRKPPAKVRTILLQKVNSRVEFYTLGIAGVAGAEYISARITGDEVLPLRIYAHGKKDLWKLLQNNAIDFTGVVKRIGGAEGFSYGLLDLRSIEEVEDDMPTDTYPVYGGEFVTEDEWNKKVQRGCAWCLDVPDIVDAEELEWINRNDHVCPECMSLPEVSELVGK